MTNAPDRPTILWFRQDLRLSDNPALSAAIARGAVIPLYILDDETPGAWKPGGAARWWLHESLAVLGADLTRRGGKLILRRGEAESVIEKLVEETNAQAVTWNRIYEPFAIARDKRIKAALDKRGIKAESFNAALLVEPWLVATGGDTPFRVFTPFWKNASAKVDVSSLSAAPPKIRSPAKWPKSEQLAAWALQPTSPNWATAIAATWTPGERGAQERLHAFLDGALSGYADKRDRPDGESTSKLSPHLHWGEIGPRQVWRALQSIVERNGDTALETHAAKFRAELGWREFAHHLLYHFPHIAEQNFRPQFDRFPWKYDERLFAAWSRGRTGYPIVDAGMRELWATGFMHNRVRMIAASFLVKHLLIPWQNGARWFWDTLVDADLANNSAGWQWVAGSGADAAPYFRIFNPIIQGEKFDPEGIYVRKWVPELRACDTRLIHRPWDASDFASFAYTPKIVEHNRARQRALEAYDAIAAKT